MHVQPTTKRAIYYYTDPKAVIEFGGGGGSIHLDGIQCLGNESSLLQCVHDGFGVHDCFHYEDAGVSCGNFPSLLISMQWSCSALISF